MVVHGTYCPPSEVSPCMCANTMKMIHPMIALCHVYIRKLN